jgi:hypothetical protein
MIWSRSLGVRPHHPPLGTGHRVFIGLLGERLGDPEVEQSDLPGGGDEDVRWLQVAVDHEVSMGVLHRLADADEHREPLLDPQPARVAVVVQGHPVHVLHGEPGLALRRDPAVEQPGDVGVIQAGEDLPFGEEAAEDLVGVHAALDQLEGDPLLELPVGALGEIDDPHPAAPQLADRAIRPDPLLHPLVLQLEHGPGDERGGALEEPLRRSPCQHRLDFGPQIGVTGAHLIEERQPLFQRQVQGAVEDPRDDSPALAGVGSRWGGWRLAHGDG